MPKDSGDVSSDSHQSVATSTSSLSANRLLSGRTRGWQKWTYTEPFLMFRIVHVIVLILLHMQIIIYENFVVVVAVVGGAGGAGGVGEGAAAAAAAAMAVVVGHMFVV